MILSPSTPDSLACVTFSHYNPLTENEKGMAYMKNVLLTVCCLMVAVGIFTGMVLYTISQLRQYEYQILTGETAAPGKSAAIQTDLKSVPFGTDFFRVLK